MTTTEKSKVMAECMEIPKCDRCEDCGHYKYGSSIYYTPDEMRYHESWDWIIQVAQKLYKELKDVPNPDSANIQDVEVLIAIEELEDYNPVSGTTVEQLFEAVYQGIELLNKLKENETDNQVDTQSPVP